MAPGYGISSIGNYANDSAFWNAYNSYNPSMAYAYQAAAQQAAAQQQAASAVQPSYTTNATTSTDPTFKGTEKSESSSSGISTGLIVGGTIVAGAATLLYAAKKGNGQGVKAGFKNIWNSITGKGAAQAADKADDVVSKVSSIIKDGGKNLKEYTIQKDGMSFVMKDGKPVKIITQDKKVIDKAKDITAWLKKNPSVRSEVNGLNLRGTTLPKGVSLAYTKEIADGKNTYKMFVENGKVVKAASKDKAGKWIDVAEDQFEGFIRNHAKQVKEAETLQKTLYGKKVQILNGKGKLVTQTGNVQMNVRNGEVIAAKFNGKDLKPEELKALGKDFKSDIGIFGRENGSRYGLTNYEYVYRQKGGQTIRFDNSRKIKNVTSVSQKDITNSDAIKSWFEKNEGIKSEIDNIASTGSLSSGYRFGNMVYKDDAGRTFQIAGDKIQGIKLNKKITLCGKTFKAGDLINGKYLGEWRKTAENGNAYDTVLAMLG